MSESKFYEVVAALGVVFRDSQTWSHSRSSQLMNNAVLVKLQEHRRACWCYTAFNTSLITMLDQNRARDHYVKEFEALSRGEGEYEVIFYINFHQLSFEKCSFVQEMVLRVYYLPDCLLVRMEGITSINTTLLNHQQNPMMLDLYRQLCQKPLKVPISNDVNG